VGEVRTCPRCGRGFDDPAVRFCPVDGAAVTESDADPNIGLVLYGQFEVQDECGQGAMGTVYRAHQRTIDRIVAIKILRRELLQEPGVVRRFVREARAAAKLSHPNIVAVHLVGETDDGVPFLVMEYVDGVSLEALCQKDGRQSPARTIALGRQIATALAEAHHAGIVHRDLKPANILVSAHARVPDLVKVLDFGIAKIVDRSGGESQVTRDGMIFGTPHYIAPEQASGEAIDARADLYALGVILFRLTTGRLPFEGGAGMQVVLRHLREPPPRPRDLEPSIPEPLESLILSCLAKDRSERPASAEALLSELEWIEAALPNLPVEPATHGATARMKSAPEEPPAGELAAPSPWRRRALSLLGGGLAAALVVGTLAGLLIARARHPAPRVAAPARAASQAALVPVLAAVRPLVSRPLVDEHVTRQGGLTLRAGFVAPPAEHQAATLRIELDGAAPHASARVEVALRAPGATERRLPARLVDGGYALAVPFAGPGAYALRAIASLPDRAPLQLGFAVELPAAATARAPARPERRRGTRAPDELPLTVVPAAPPRAPPIAPRLLASPAPEPAAAPEPAPPEPAPAPKPALKDDDPGPPPMPAPSDPTTLPPPAPDETR
jgi:serine/threonine-protein kinase